MATNKSLLTLWEVLKSVPTPNVLSRCKVVALRLQVQRVLEAILMVRDEIEAAAVKQEIEAKRIERCQHYATKDERGDAILGPPDANGQRHFDFTPDNWKAFQADMVAYTDSRKADIAAYEAKRKELAEVLKQDTPFTARVPFTFDDFTEGITTSQLEVLYPYIADPFADKA